LFLQGNPLEKLVNVRKMSDIAHLWLAKRKAKSFYTAINAETLRIGVQSMLQVMYIITFVTDVL
jgi:hypothetical protein